jgi:TPR repeat protein
MTMLTSCRTVASSFVLALGISAVAVATSQTPTAFPRQQTAQPNSPENAGVTDLRRAAERGDAEAQFNLALRYYIGEGVPQDYA